MESGILIASAVAILGAERLGFALESRGFRRPWFWTDVLHLLTGVIGLGLLVRWLGAKAVESHGPLLPGLGAAPSFVVGGLAVASYDLGSWVSHALLHRFTALWRLHKVHHSSRRLDWLATFRGHLLEHALRHSVSAGGLLLVGFPLWSVGLAAAVYSSWASLLHANLRWELRILEPVFMTPRLHRYHHVPEAGPRNLGTIFSWWDRASRTLVSGGAVTARCDVLGVPGEVETYPQRWLPQLVEPFR